MKIKSILNNQQESMQQRTGAAYNIRGSESPCHDLLVLALGACLGIALCFAPNTHADCTLFYLDHCVKGTASKTGNTVDKNFMKPIGGTAQHAGNLTTQQTANSGDLAKKGYDESKKTATAFVKGPLVKDAKVHWNKIKGKIRGLGNAFNSVSTTNEFQALASAVGRQDSNAIARILPKVLYPVLVQTDKDKTWSEFDKMIKAGKVGTLLLSWSGGFSLDVGVDVDIGIALDIAYVRYARQQYKLAPNKPFTNLPFQGSIGSIFTSAGGSIGFSTDASRNFVFGYHSATPAEFGGPGFCLGLQPKEGDGNLVDVCWDISGSPWKIVTAGIAFGPGTEVNVSGGASYTAVVAKVCNIGSCGCLGLQQRGVRRCERYLPMRKYNLTPTIDVTTITATFTNPLDYISRYVKENNFD